MLLRQFKECSQFTREKSSSITFRIASYDESKNHVFLLLFVEFFNKFSKVMSQDFFAPSDTGEGLSLRHCLQMENQMKNDCSAFNNRNE